MTEPTASTPPAEMPKALVQFLLGGQTCVISTVDDGGRPMTTLMTWVVARDPSTITIAVDTRGRALKNIRGNPHVALEVLGDDLCYGVRGTAVVEKDLMQSAPFPCALVALRVEECRDHSAAGIKFFGPKYTWHPGKEHRAGTEEKVFSELKGPMPTI
jgi:flavin reductase (DIM6/NTAB) family NADH-FMN oxidoreductase RutF